MVITEFLIDYKKAKKITFFPAGDFHFKSAAFNEKRFNDWVKVVKEAENPIVALDGDIIDEDNKKMRIKRTAMYFETNRIDSFKADDNDHKFSLDKNVIPKLSFLNKHNCLGATDGNHHRLYSDGFTSTQHICSKLGIPYLGSGQAIISLKFIEYHNGKSSNMSNRGCFNIHMRHGINTATKEGNNINKMIEFASFYHGIDCYIKGHTHRPSIVSTSVMSFNPAKMNITNKEIIIVNCGNFLDNYAYNRTTYTEEREYPATSYRQCYIEVYCRRSGSEGWIETKFGYF